MTDYEKEFLKQFVGKSQYCNKHHSDEFVLYLETLLAERDKTMKEMESSIDQDLKTMHELYKQIYKQKKILNGGKTNLTT